MKVSINWLKTYLQINEPTDKIAEMLTDLGLEVEGIETTGGLRGNLEGVVVGHVVECAKHPDADKLSLTQVNIGAAELVQIVCGAPNVRAGQKVPVATVGTTLYPFGSDEPLKIKAGKIRGQASNGMICAQDELGIGTDHAGIMILADDAAVGTPVRDLLDIESDTVIEIGLTPNRSDATSQTGVARDLAARLRIAHEQDVAVKMPDVSAFKVQNHTRPIAVEVRDVVGAPRYSGVSIVGVTIGESPEWLKKRLQSLGINSINNVVDVTNFVLHELGQPLHAFDADKIAGQKIIVQTLTEGTPFKCLKKRALSEKEILEQNLPLKDAQGKVIAYQTEVVLSLSAEDLMICDANGTPMCVAGVIGSNETGVSATTTNLFLESAFFNPKQLRRTSFRHDTRTDAAKTFEKGTDPNQTVYALQRAALLIQEVAGGVIASDIVDVYPTPILPVEVTVTLRKVRNLIGLDISADAIRAIFQALEMPILSENAEGFTVQVPTNKADVLREVDVIEEILRIYGYNRVPIPTEVRSSIAIAAKPDAVRIKNLVADALAANGFYEMMALSLSQSKYYDPKETAHTTEQAQHPNFVYINNTSNMHLNIMRPTMLLSALETVAHNLNRQQNDLRLFEFGKTYTQTAVGKYNESARLSLTLTGARQAESWLAPNGIEVTFYTLKAYVEAVLQRLGIGGYQATALDGSGEEAMGEHSFHFGVKYHRGAQNLVTFGKVAPHWLKQLGIKQTVFFADFDWDNLLKTLKNAKVQYSDVPRFPSVRRDLALVVEKNITFAQLSSLAQKTSKSVLKAVNLFDVFEDETKVGVGKKSYALSFIFEDAEKTLQEKDIDKLCSDLMTAFETKLGAIVRK